MRDFEVFSAFCDGSSAKEAAQKLKTTPSAASRLADAALARLTRQSVLPPDVIRSVFFPRRCGERGGSNSCGGYSAAAVSVSRALALYEWEQIASAVEWAQTDLEEKGLTGLRSVLSGEREPEELYPPRLEGAHWDIDLVLWSDVNGLYFDQFLDAPIEKLLVRPATTRPPRVFEVSGVVGHERILLRSHDLSCRDFVARRNCLQAKSAKPLIERETIEIVMRLAADASPKGRDIVFHRGSSIGWVATDSEAQQWKRLLRDLKAPRSISLERAATATLMSQVP